MRPILRALAVLLAPVLLVLQPAGAAAFSLTNCTMDITALNASGSTIDTATAGGKDATQAAPFEATWDGSVEWSGTMGSQVIKDYHWGISLFNIPTPQSGSDANEDGDTEGNGTIDLRANLPFKVTGLFYVSGEFSGDGGSCTGNGWMRLVGDPVGTIPFWAAIVLLVLGAGLCWLSWRRGWLWALLGGLFLGLAFGALPIMFALMPAGPWTPLVGLAIGVLIGVGLSMAAPESV